MFAVYYGYTHHHIHPCLKHQFHSPVYSFRSSRIWNSLNYCRFFFILFIYSVCPFLALSLSSPLLLSPDVFLIHQQRNGLVKNIGRPFEAFQPISILFFFIQISAHRQFSFLFFLFCYLWLILTICIFDKGP